jgi:hypothetical protein
MLQVNVPRVPVDLEKCYECFMLMLQRVDLDIAMLHMYIARVASVLSKCLHFSSRDLNVSINMKHMLQRVCTSFSMDDYQHF